MSARSGAADVLWRGRLWRWGPRGWETRAWVSRRLVRITTSHDDSVPPRVLRQVYIAVTVRHQEWLTQAELALLPDQDLTSSDEGN